MIAASINETPAMIYLPTRGIKAIHAAAIIKRRYSLLGFGFLSADLPPQILPTAIAIIIVPIIIVQIIWLLLKYGDSKREAAISTAIIDRPLKKLVRYKNHLRLTIS